MQSFIRSQRRLKIAIDFWEIPHLKRMLLKASIVRCCAGCDMAAAQVAFHASAALRQYFRTHLVLHVAALKRRLLSQAGMKQVRISQRGDISSRPASFIECARWCYCAWWECCCMTTNYSRRL